MKRSTFIALFFGLLVFGLVFAGQTFAKVDLKNAFLIWTFEEGSGTKVTDLSGNGNDGTFVGNVKWTTGKSGGGVQFDGKSTAIKTQTTNNVGKTAFTECLWVKFDDLTPENMFGYISCKGTGSTRFFYYSTWSAAGGLHDSVHAGTLKTDGTWGRGIATGRVFKTNQWYFVSAVIDTKEGFIKVYVDGGLLGDGQIAIDKGDVPGTPSEIWVGASPEGYQWLAGTVDDVAMFNVALSAEDLKEIMNNGIAKVVNITAVKASEKLPTTWSSIKIR